MTDGEYEEAYTEALLVAHELLNDSESADPFLEKDGTRRAFVGPTPLTDHQVFALAWGENVATRIKQERNAACPTKGEG